MQGRTPRRLLASNEAKRLSHDARESIGRSAGKKGSVSENSVMKRLVASMLPLGTIRGKIRRPTVSNARDVPPARSEKSPNSSAPPLMNSTEDSGGSVSYASETAEVEWSALKSALAADRFDNGRSPEQLRRSFENSLRDLHRPPRFVHRRNHAGAVGWSL